ncbi:MAG: hypothetical protein EOP36_04480 [Rubrivivax sp.]|nr:MAG: hypothetical protein EOP36_04480 [Rubrivivax sp.]
MTISPYFHELRSAYQAEMDDLSFDSDGQDVLRQRLSEKRGQLDFLLQMIDISPEMVAVIFHQGFRFTLPAVMDHLLSQEHDELPDWASLTGTVQVLPWAQELAEVFCKQPSGERFMVVAAALEYMHAKADPTLAAQGADQDDDHDHDGEEGIDHEDNGDDARTPEEAGADWLAEQGFDRKD